MTGYRIDVALILDDLVDLHEPVHFDHKAHAPGTIPPCKECHTLGSESGDLRKPNLKGAYHRQCLACHAEWSHETECNACHRPRAGIAAPAGGTAAGSSDPTDIVGRTHPPIVTFQHKEHSELFGFRCVDCHRATTATRRTRAPSATTRRSAPASPTTVPAGRSIRITSGWTAGHAIRAARTSSA